MVRGPGVRRLFFYFLFDVCYKKYKAAIGLYRTVNLPVILHGFEAWSFALIGGTQVEDSEEGM
jgi:hypothetical protein